MIVVDNATVSVPDAGQARPVGQVPLTITIGDHEWVLMVDDDELIDALASRIR